MDLAACCNEGLVTLDRRSCVEEHPLAPERLAEARAPDGLEDAGIQATEPEGDATLPDATLAFDERLERRVFEIGNTTHVERHDARGVFLDPRAQLLADVLRVGEIDPPLGPDDQEPLERFVVRMLG